MNNIHSSTITAVLLAVFTMATGAGQSASDTIPDLIISSEGGYWQPGNFIITTNGVADVTVDEKSKKQLWEGFGGTFNEAGWDALSVVSSEIPRALKLLFDETDGANLAYGRMPIGASDYAMDWYTLAETAGDYAMDHFSIERDRDKLIPYVKAALEVKPDLHLWASPWNPPSWMIDASEKMKDDPQTQEAYALYLARFVEEYAKENLKIEAIHPQNEPGYAKVKWSESLFITFIKNYLGPTFEERGITSEIWCGTMSHPDDGDIAVTCMNDAAAMKYVKGFGLQWNLEGVVATLSRKGRVWQTEHRCGNYNFTAKYWDQNRYDPDKPQNDHRYAEESWQLIRDWIAAGVNAYNAWNMVLDTYGKSLYDWPQNALLVVDRSVGKLIVTPAYYVFRHFSQYVTPGATLIETNGSNDALAFMNPDGSIIVEVYNKEDASKKMTVSITGKLYQFDVPAHGWGTLRVKQPASAENGSRRQFYRSSKRLEIIRTAGGHLVTLPCREPGYIELLTPDGRVLDSRRFSGKSRSIALENNLQIGLLLIRLHYDKTTISARFCNLH